LSRAIVFYIVSMHENATSAKLVARAHEKQIAAECTSSPVMVIAGRRLRWGPGLASVSVP
jgi:hypothetical protein